LKGSKADFSNVLYLVTPCIESFWPYWPLHTWPLTFVTSKALYTRKLSIHGVCTYLATDFREFKSLCKYTFENFKVTLQKYLALGKLRFFNFFYFSISACLPEFATSSVGKLRGFTKNFFRSLRTGAVGGDEAPVLHVYPSLGQNFFFSSLVRFFFPP